jgi:hypothetical protein
MFVKFVLETWMKIPLHGCALKQAGKPAAQTSGAHLNNQRPSYMASDKMDLDPFQGQGGNDQSWVEVMAPTKAGSSMSQ